MNKESFPFRVGRFECLVINDGTIVVPDMVTPRPFNPNDPRSGLAMSTNCLLIRTGERKILVDTGCGNWFGSSSGKLVANLNTAGISTSEIDTVVITHAHGDHIGANVDAEGRPVFSNARYLFHRNEWEYWIGRLEATANDPKDAMSMVRKNLMPIRDRVELIGDKASIAPCIEVALVPGHTPGHIMLYVSSEIDRLCCISDLIHHPLELVRPELFTIFDVDPDKATATRKRVPPELADPALLLWSCHLDFPGLGHIAKQGEALVWQPISLPGS
jgi:glyoxylase-like metal-dependent hydrolase (beta-lactamase superfamily II)